MTTWRDKGGRKWGEGVRGERTVPGARWQEQEMGETHFEKPKDMKIKSFIISRVD